jgi:hypothetical protein
MKRLLLMSISVLFLSLAAVASAPQKSKFHKHNWYFGEVVLNNGDTLHGQLNFTRKVTEGLLQVLQGMKIKVLTVKDVRSFSYFDNQKKTERKFVTMPLTPEFSTREHEVFVEQVYGNFTFTIVNHRTLGYPSGKFHFNPLKRKSVVDNQYLVVNHSGEIVRMSIDNLLVLMKNDRRAVLEYIRERGIKVKKIEDFISVLDFHQSLAGVTF